MTIPLPNGKNQFADANGAPYASGTLDMYIPGTTTRKNTYSNAARTVLNANPIVLDSAGRCVIYGNGSYRQVLKDSLGNTIWDEATADGSSTALVVATYAAARALVAAEVTGANSLVYIQGRTSTNDGGQGFYYWNTTSTATDDGGVYIQLTGVVTGRLIRSDSALYIRPEWYGALRDGVTDDTAAIQSACSAISTAGGGTLYLSPGTYNVTTLTAGTALVTFTNINGVSIEGPDTTLADQQAGYTTAFVYGSIFRFTGCTNISIGRTGALKVTATDEGAMVRGCRPVEMFGANANLYIDIDVTGGAFGLQCLQTSGAITAAAHTRGVRGRIRTFHTYYGFNAAWSGDEVDLALDCQDAHRSFFIYGVSNVHIRARVRDQQASSIITAYEGYGCSDVFVEYYDRETTDSNNDVALYLSWSDTTAATHRNINMHFDVNNPTVDGWGTTLRMAKLDAGAPDAVDRGHALYGWVISGVMQQTAGKAQADNQGTFSGTEVQQNVTLENLSIIDGTGFTLGLSVYAQPFLMKSVVSNVTISSGVPASEGAAVVASSLTATNAIVDNEFTRLGALGGSANRGFFVEGQKLQFITFRLVNTGGTLQHQIINGNTASVFVDRVNGASSSLTNTPTGADASTAMAAGAKIGSAQPYTIWLDTVTQTIANQIGNITVADNTTGQSFMALLSYISLDINGVTRNRPAIIIIDATTGAAFTLSTANIAAGEFIVVQIPVFLL